MEPQPQFDPDKRIRQYLKLAGLDQEVKKCEILHAEQSQEKYKSNGAALAQLKAKQEKQYINTLKRLNALHESFKRVLAEVQNELIAPSNIEIGKELSAKEAFTYLEKTITHIEGMQKEDGKKEDGKTSGSDGN